MRSLPIASAVSSALLLTGGGLWLAGQACAANHVVTANANMTFSPRTLTINAGDTVTFRNGGGIHNVTSDPGSITAFRCANGCDGAGGSGALSGAAWSATVTFPTAGTIRYFCQAHGGANGAGMSGTITVMAAPPPPPVVKHESDFNHDGRSDILWRNVGSGGNTIWRSGNGANQQAVPSVPIAWRAVGYGDYNGDGFSDILWRNSASGANVIWRSANAGVHQNVTSVTNLFWTVVGSGDYDADGRADLLWRNTGNGQNVIWRAANSASQRGLPTVPLAWRVAGSGDFNHDGRSDILWTHSSGVNVIWLSGDAAAQQHVTGVGTAWTVAGTGDYDGDGRADIFWRSTAGQDVIWRAGNSASLLGVPSVPVAWRVVGSGDYNGDNKADILWRNSVSGLNVIWLSANAGTQQAVSTVPSQSWTVIRLP